MVVSNLFRSAASLHRFPIYSKIPCKGGPAQRIGGLRSRPWIFVNFQSTATALTQSNLPVITSVDRLPLTHDLPSLASTPTRSPSSDTQSLPTTCPGCGALSHSVTHDEAGFYSRSRKAVKAFLRQKSDLQSRTAVVNIAEISEALEQVREKDDTGSSIAGENTTRPQETPVCDRCHDLIYNNKGRSIVHPTVEALADSIAESPFKRNHVYHVLDAADFPMSLIPRVFQALELAKPRSQNRRARTKYTSKPTVSFIITRSDLLGTSKQMVDRMLPYFQSVLRSALGRQARDIRLGNIHLVSAKRGWWTKELKDSIWERGGGNWMVGKVNVGKSNLFPVLFPKGSGERAPVYNELVSSEMSGENAALQHGSVIDESSLLPPAQPEMPFPAMPVVSHLPGTTASPIRLPFGNHKGELVDLPGLERGNLEDYVRPDHKLDLVMQYRPNVKQYIVKSGQSLLLGGGLIRITPQLDTNDPSMTMLAYPFVPLDAHVTATDKAIGLQSQDRESGVKTILADGVGSGIQSCGLYSLSTDVTRSRAGPLLRAGVPIMKLPFRVYSCDIVIEGVGWVELVCQVRQHRDTTSIDRGPIIYSQRSGATRPTGSDNSSTSKSADGVSSEAKSEFKPFFEQRVVSPCESMPGVVDSFTLPKVEVFSPNGKHVGQRKPLGAWMLWNEGRDRQRKGVSSVRPRKSMKGVKKIEKARGRATPATHEE